MAKLTLAPIGSFSQSAVTTINQNMDAVEAALEKTLSRDGTIPNQMTADLDMNENDILNVGTIDANYIILAGNILLPTGVTSVDISIIRDALNAPIDVQNRTELAALDYTKIRGAIVWNEGGRNGVFVFNQSNLATKVTSDPAQGIYVAPAAAPTGATGAWQRVYEGAAILNWFGAVGDGTTDDAAAMNNAWSAATWITGLPGYTYKFNSLVGSTTLLPSRRLTGGSDMVLKWGASGAQLAFNGNGWELSDWTLQTTTTVAVAVTSNNTAFDGRIERNIYNGGVTAGFDIFFDAYEWWDSFFCDNVIFNTSGATKNGIAVRGSYSVNNTITGNKLARFHDCIYLTATPRPTYGTFCEGWILDGNHLLANDRHIVALAGTLLQVTNSILDLPTTGETIRCEVISPVVIANNWIVGGTIVLKDSSRHIISGNTFSGGGTANILAFQNVLVSTVTGNSFYNVNSAVDADSSSSYISFTGNSITISAVACVSMASSTNCVFMANTLYQTVSPALRFDCKRDAPMRFLNISTAQTGANTTPTTLMSTTMTKEELLDNTVIKISTWGTLGANANTKTMTLLVGGVSLGGLVTTANGSSWKLEYELTIKSARTAFEFSRETIVGATPNFAITSSVQDMTIDNTVVIQGTNGTASAGDIVCEGLRIDILNSAK